LDAKTAGSRPVLVPLDGSALADQAIPYALALVEPGAPIYVLRVIPHPEPVRDRSGQILVPADAVLATNEEAARGERERAAQRVRDIAATVRIEVAAGDIAEQILRTVEERDVGLIVMTSRGRGTLGRWAFGSIADRIARATPVPVMIVRADDEAAEPRPVAIRRLIVPLDGSEVAAEALPVAQAIAGRLGLPVLLLRAIDPMRLLAPARGIGMMTQGDLYELIHARLQAEAEEALAGAAAELRAAGVTTDWEVLVGEAAERMASAARSGDVIVLTSRGHGGLRRWLLGSVAEQLVRSAPVPVVLVPDAERRAAERSASPAGAGERGGATEGA
jgi:nucleotide-binding universal stress UspA family protein